MTEIQISHQLQTTANQQKDTKLYIVLAGLKKVQMAFINYAKFQ